jgi:hypothetical protein
MKTTEPFIQNKRVAIPVGIIVLLAVGAVLLLHQLGKPVSATAIVTTGNTAVPKPSQPIAVSNAYARFTYPGTMQPITGMQGPTGEIVAIYNYKMTDVVPWHLSITINLLHESGLTYDSAYLLRKNHPAQYQPSTVTVDNNTFTVMTDTQAGNFSKVAFTLHGDLSADISLTGDDANGDTTLAQAFQQVLHSWQWQ